MKTIKDAFEKLYGTEEAYMNKQSYSALYVFFLRGWNACEEAAQQSEQADEPFTWQCQGCGAVLWSNQNEHCPNCG